MSNPIAWKNETWAVRRLRRQGWSVEHAASGLLALTVYYRADAIKLAKHMPKIGDPPGDAECAALRAWLIGVGIHRPLSGFDNHADKTVRPTILTAQP